LKLGAESSCICMFIINGYKKEKEKVGKWISLCCKFDYKWVTVMNGVKFEFNDLISLYKKNYSERKQSVSLWYY